MKVYIGINNKTDKFRQELIWQKRLRQCTRFYYKQQFYKQRQAEIEKKKKLKVSNTLRLNIFYLKIIRILHPRYHPKVIGHILNNKQKNSESVFARSYD